MSKYRLKIATVTTSRADFGILFPVISYLNGLKKINHKLIVTGSHFLKKYGSSLQEINEKKIKKKILLNPFKFSKNINANKLSENILKLFNQFFSKNKTDLLIILGDRFELLPVAYSATINKIKIVHFNGGELTSGAIDDEIRHAITKLSDLHFVSNKIYRKRVIQMGESPKNVINTGYLGLDKKFLQQLDQGIGIRKIINIDNNLPICTIVLHPETKNENDKKNVKIFFKFIKKITNTNVNIVMSYPNIDYGNENIISEINKLKNKKNFFIIRNIGHLNYLKLIRDSKILIGNSSSGLLEAPYLKAFTINVGERQMGREKEKTVFNVKYNYFDLLNIYNKLINKKKQNISFKNMPIKKIVNKIVNFNFKKKRFRDLNNY